MSFKGLIDSVWLLLRDRKDRDSEDREDEIKKQKHNYV
jgi:hypothetical protein